MTINFSNNNRFSTSANLTTRKNIKNIDVTGKIIDRIMRRIPTNYLS